MGRWPREAVVNRRAVEAQLLQGERETLEGWARTLGLPGDAWDQLPGLRNVVESVAVSRAMESYQQRGQSEAAARRSACAKLGVSWRAHHKRLREWLARGAQHLLCAAFR